MFGAVLWIMIFVIVSERSLSKEKWIYPNMKLPVVVTKSVLLNSIDVNNQCYCKGASFVHVNLGIHSRWVLMLSMSSSYYKMESFKDFQRPWAYNITDSSEFNSYKLDDPDKTTWDKTQGFKIHSYFWWAHIS